MTPDEKSKLFMEFFASKGVTFVNAETGEVIMEGKKQDD